MRSVLLGVVEAEAPQAIGNESARPVLLEAELGMPVKIVPSGSELRPERVVTS
jgi:hypothetical protein